MSRWSWRRDAEQRRGRSCVVGDGLLQSYLDGETDPATARCLRAHVAECPRCAAELSAYREVKRALVRDEGVDEEAVKRLRDFAESLAHDGEEASEGAVPEAGV